MDKNENLQDDQTMPEFGGGEEPASNVTSMARRAAEGEQASALPPPPGSAQPGYINPPSLEAFSNATYMRVSKQIDKVIAGALRMEEFKALRGIEFMALWRRSGKPTIDGDENNRRYVGVSLVGPLEQFVAAEMDVDNYPHFIINFYWIHFEELRKDDEGASFVPEKELERHVFFALRHIIASDSGVLTLRTQAGIEIWADVVKHYGLVTDPLMKLARQARLWDSSLTQG